MPTINLLYLILQQKVSLASHPKMDIITKKKFFEVLAVLFHVPLKYRYLILKEMVELNLLEVINRNELKVLPRPINIDDINNLQRLLGIIL